MPDMKDGASGRPILDTGVAEEEVDMVTAAISIGVTVLIVHSIAYFVMQSGNS
jgi:hypothetical protein